MQTGENLETIDITAEVERYFDDSSKPGNGEPKLVVVMGPVAVGKSRLRRERFSKHCVTVDAGDIFIQLSRGRYIPFPSFLEEAMDMGGNLVAHQAVQERRNIVCELIGVEVEPVKKLMDAFRSLGYFIDVVGVTADFEQSARWNQERSDDNISAYYTEPYHHRWLLAAAAAAKQ